MHLTRPGWSGDKLLHSVPWRPDRLAEPPPRPAGQKRPPWRARP